MSRTANTGVVIIGRNEGARLIRCLASVGEADGPVVYVDSGSTDGSQKAARQAGADVVDLDLSHPFTAARAQCRDRAIAVAAAGHGFHTIHRRRLRVAAGLD